MDLFDIVAGRRGGTGGGGASQKQVDWEQNDNTKVDYIKNKPFGTEKQKIDYVSFISSDADPTTEAITINAINLIEGNSYSVDMITDSGTTNLQLTAINASENLGFDCIMLDYGTSEENTRFQIYDKINVDNFENPTSGTNAICIIQDKTIKEIRVHIDYVSFLRKNIDPKTQMVWMNTIDLVAGNMYSVDMITDTDTTNLQLTAINSDVEGSVAIGYTVGEQTLFIVVDKVDVDDKSNLISGTKVGCGLYGTTIQEIRIHGVSTTATIINKLSNEYINIDQTYSPTSENAQSGTAVAQAVEAAGIRKIRHIELGTGETANMLKISTDEDGNPFELSEAFFTAHLVFDVSETTSNLRIRADGGVRYIVLKTGLSLSNGIITCSGTINAHGGILTTSAVYSTTDNPQTADTMYGMVAKTNSINYNLKDIEAFLYGSAFTELKEGSFLELWGVKL